MNSFFCCLVKMGNVVLENRYKLTPHNPALYKLVSVDEGVIFTKTDFKETCLPKPPCSCRHRILLRQIMHVSLSPVLNSHWKGVLERPKEVSFLKLTWS